MHFSSSATIDAPAEAVWDILTDLRSWPTWNTTVVSSEDTVAVGESV